MPSNVLRVLIIKEDDLLVAQCLEHDIAVQASNIDDLQRRFEDAIVLENGMGSLDGIPPAPEDFHEKWDLAEAMKSNIDNAEMRLAA